MQLRGAVGHRHVLDNAGHPLIVVRNRIDLGANQVRSAGNVLTQQHRVERLGELLRRADRADLSDLRDQLVVV
jgi:hypothetical protein